MANKYIKDEDTRNVKKFAHTKEMVATNLKWWTLPDDGVGAAQAARATIELWVNKQRYRLINYNIQSRLYGNLPAFQVAGATIGYLSSIRHVKGDRLTHNVAQSVVDTLVSKMAQNKVIPYYDTDGGDYKAQRIAEARDQFIRGLFDECNTYKLYRRAVKDTCVFGDGFIHVFEKNKRVCHERVDLMEMWVDDLEAAQTRPSQMIRMKNVDRSVLMEMYPEQAKTIDSAQRINLLDSMQMEATTDLVTVMEAWHLRSGPDADDGKHLLCVSSGPLCEMEDWTKDYYPFARLSYSERPRGYWAQGLVEQLQGIQMELNNLLSAVQISMSLASTFKIWVQNGSKVSVDHINNSYAPIMRGDIKPEVMLFPIVQPEIYQQIQTLKNSAYEQAGISRMDATSQKPAGDLSGEALRLTHQIGTERFMSFGQDNEDFVLDIAKKSIDVVADIMERDGEYNVEGQHLNTIFSLDWKDLVYPQNSNQFVLKCYPVSSLPSTPEGRTQKIEEWMQAGLIRPEIGRELLGMPDTGAYEGLANASSKYLKMILDDMIETGKYTSPTPFDNLQLAAELSAQYYNKARIQHVPESKQNLIIRFIKDVKQLLAPPLPPQLPPAQPQLPQGLPPSEPLAKPAVPPVSELLPNQPTPRKV